MATPSSAPRIVAGRYILEENFRAGGMARVYRAYDRVGRVEVAVKILTRQVQPDQRLLNLEFDRATRSHARLRHENVVELLSAGRDDETGERYLVFSWFEEDLGTVLDRFREVPDERPGWDDFATSLGLPILRGLAHAHIQQVLHRDVKPSNVLISADGTPRLADFGIAKLKTDFQPGLTFAEFMTRPFAPKELDEGDFSYTRDVHAYAVLCLVALTGVDPFAEAYKDDVYKVIADALESLDVPAEASQFLATCVSERPDERPFNAAVALARLEAIQAAREQKWVEPRTVWIELSEKAREQIRLELRLDDASQVSKALENDLAGDSAFAPFLTKEPKEGQSNEGHFTLIGEELKLHVAVKQGTEDALWVFSASALPGSLLEKLRDLGYREPLLFRVGQPTNRTDARESLLELRLAIADHDADQRQRARAEEERRIFRVWRATLDAKADLEREREAPIEYEKATTQGRRIVFQLKGEAPDDLIGQSRQLALRDGGFLGGEIYDVREGRAIMDWRYGDLDRLPQRGILRVDTWPAKSAILRQMAALDSVTFNRGLRSDLDELLLKPEQATPPEPVADVEFIQSNLDDPKKQAVRAALGTEDLLVVQGPPGTGKTTFIAEVVLQTLRRTPDARILVTSQTHAALDNVLERLADLDDDLRLVRVARAEDPRVSPGVEQFLLEEQIGSWTKDAVARGRRYLREWARANSISERTVEIATLYGELAAEIESVDALAIEQMLLADELSRVSSVPGGTTAQQHGAQIEERLTGLGNEVALRERRRGDLLGRLVQLRAIEQKSELEGVSVAELRGRAEAEVDREHPAFGRCQALLRILADWHARFGRGDEFHAAVLVGSEVVASTCLGLQSIKGADQIEFDLCIVDEASKATATETLVPMVQARRWILVGDPRQLPPFVEDALRHRDVLGEHDLSEDEVRATLFDHLIERLPPSAKTLLSKQHRMLPAIGNLISECFYDGALESAPAERPSWLSYSFRAPVTWLTTSRLRDRFEARVGTSFANQREARVIRDLCRRINGTAKWAETTVSVAILTGYTAQRDLVEREIAEERESWGNVSSLECSSVDAFQGREADIVIYSVTRANQNAKIGFLKERSRLNVALSRGRFGLVLVGDHVGTRAASDPNPFRSVVDYIETHPDDCQIEEVST